MISVLIIALLCGCGPSEKERTGMLNSVLSASFEMEMARAKAGEKSATVADGVDYQKWIDRLQKAKDEALAANIPEDEIRASGARGSEHASKEIAQRREAEIAYREAEQERQEKSRKDMESTLRADLEERLKQIEADAEKVRINRMRAPAEPAPVIAPKPAGEPALPPGVQRAK